MTPGIRVSSADPVVAAWLGGWLAAMELAPPAALTMHVDVVDTLLPDDDAREPFRQPRLEIRSGPPSGTLAIRWLDGDARAVLPAAGQTATVTIARSALGDRERVAQTFLIPVLVFLLRRGGWHHVHGAIARDPRGREWLFAGDSQAGKSTTAALLATHRWSVGADDLTFLAANGTGVEAIAPRVPIALRPAAYDLLKLDGGSAARGGRKTAFTPEDLGGTFAARVRPSIIMMPVVGGGPTSAQRLRTTEGVTELMRWSAWVALEPDLAQGHLDLLAALAKQAQCYRLTLGPDLFAGRDLLMELVP